MKKILFLIFGASAALACLALPVLAEEAAAGHGGESPNRGGIFDVDPGYVIWTVVNFLLLMAVLWYFAWRPISAMLVKRTESIEGKIKEAENLKKAAENKNAEWDRVLKTAGSKSAEILQEGREAGEAERSKILAAAKTAAEQERERARRDAELLKEKAYQDFARDAAEITSALAGKIAKKSITPSDHKQLVDDFLKDYESAGGVK